MSGQMGCSRFAGVRFRLCVMAGVVAVGFLYPEHAWADTALLPTPAQTIIQGFFEHLGALFIATIAGVLAYVELKAHRRTAEKRLEFEEENARTRIALEKNRFDAEATEREKLARFRAQESDRFRDSGKEIAHHVAQILTAEPNWAHHALEAAKLLPFSNTLFGERMQHFGAEKEEIAKQFMPYLLRRCEVLAESGRHVVLLIDAGTTLYPFFDILGKETMKRFQQGEGWLQRFHLATNNLPGIEQLIRTGKRAPWDRYSKLAIEDCLLLPGIPLPIFAAVAGDETEDAIRRLREKHLSALGKEEVTFVALVVGNWVRIRRTAPPCPIPMARGIEHLGVKQTLVECADEVFVVSPLGKIFVGYSNEKINSALDFGPGLPDPDRIPYREVNIGDEQAPKVKLVTTKRAEGRLLHRHSNWVEATLVVGAKERLSASVEDFARAPIEQAPNLLFPFGALPQSGTEEFLVEFPHAHARERRDLLAMFNVDR
jgi:hypothetical protein